MMQEIINAVGPFGLVVFGGGILFGLLVIIGFILSFIQAATGIQIFEVSNEEK
jgi:type III secretory pathway component EscS